MEEKQLTLLISRVKILKAHLKDLKKNQKPTDGVTEDLNNQLNSLKEAIKLFNKNLELGKVTLKGEISQVKRRVRPLGRLREETAWRIDITV